MTAKTIEEKRAKVNALYAKHKVKITARKKKWREANRERYLVWSRKSALKISYAKLAEPVPYPAPAHCEGCGIAFATKGVKGPCLDHCHVTNRFRGWLCHKCNAALGMAGDSPEGVRKLLDYIVRAYAMLDLRILK